jgi:hypothetical protein
LQNFVSDMDTLSHRLTSVTCCADEFFWLVLEPSAIATMTRRWCGVGFACSVFP